MVWGVSFEQDSQEIIQFCSKHNLKYIKVRYDEKKGWSVDQEYYDKTKQPKLWLIPLTKQCEGSAK